jgi:hypothetical protein
MDRDVLAAYQGESLSGQERFGGFLPPSWETALKKHSQNYESWVDDVTGVEGSTGLERSLRYGTGSVLKLANMPQLVYDAEQVSETIEKTPGAVSQAGVVPTVETFIAGGQQVSKGAAERAREDPYGFWGGAAGTVFGALAGGYAVSKGGTLARDVVRTAGGKKVDLEDLTQKSVIEGEENFPGASDPDLYKTDPADAVKKQAAEKTPQSVEDYFTEQGITEGSVLKKAMDVEPEGPKGKGTGFESPEASAQSYESPGSFFGPELSPHFLRVGGGRMSLRPGLPKLGGKPTGVLAKTDVENAKGSTLDDFNTELIERSGESTAITKPS